VAQFKYKSLAPDGTYTEGVMGAADRDGVISRLRANDHLPVMVAPNDGEAATVAAPPRANQKIRTAAKGRGRRPSRAAVAVFTRELQTLLEAGLPADRALEAITEATADATVAAITGDLRARLRSGNALSQALEAHPETFSSFYVAMVQAGETGGSLDNALSHLARYQERAEQIYTAVLSALIYPLILVFATLISLIILMTLVVPQFELLFRESAVDLPVTTQIVLSVSATVRDYGWLAAVALLLGWLAVRRRWRNPAARTAWDAAQLRLPVVGALLTRIEVERFARSLAALLSNGVSLPLALEFAAGTVRNGAIQSAIGEAAGNVKQGERLADSLAAVGVIPPLAIQLIRVGEESGDLAVMLLKLADIFAGETETYMKRLVTLIEPSLIILIGCFVAFVVISLLSAILEINALAI